MMLSGDHDDDLEVGVGACPVEGTVWYMVDNDLELPADVGAVVEA